jgi:hypothetical protein
MKTLLLPLIAALTLVACVGGPRYDSPPHETWQERDAYCYFFQVDPKGVDNSQIGYADEEPVMEASPAGFRLTAVNARVSTDLYDAEARGDPDDDYFRSRVTWATDSDGFVRVENRCG